MLRPAARYDLVRCGIASYGLDPAPGVTPDLGLRPAMTVRAAPGAGQADRRRRRRLLRPHVGRRPRTPRSGSSRSGYAEGVPRAAGNRVEVWAGGRPAARCAAGSAWTSSSSTSGDDHLEPGDDVVLFGPGDGGGAHRAGLGRGPRHHQLRDRDPGRRPAGPPPRGRRRPQERPGEHQGRGSSAPPPARPASPPRVPPSGSPGATGSSPTAAAGDDTRVRLPAARRRCTSSPTTRSTCTPRSTRPARPAAPPARRPTTSPSSSPTATR